MSASIPELAPRADELVVAKHYYDGFNGTALDGALRARGVTTLVLTGTMTDICVLATVVGGFNREYRMIVVEDGVATLWPEIQRATLDIIGRAYARVLIRQGGRRRAGGAGSRRAASYGSVEGMRTAMRFSRLHPGEPAPLHRRPRRSTSRPTASTCAGSPTRKGVTGIVANGHAAEVVVAHARGAQAVARHRRSTRWRARCPIIAGVYSRRHARGGRAGARRPGRRRRRAARSSRRPCSCGARR